MSWVTDIILMFSLKEIFREDGTELLISPELEKINTWLRNSGHGSFEDLAEHLESSGKAIQSCIYGGVFNHLDLERFKEFVGSQSWQAKEFVQLLIQEESEEVFSVYMFVNGRLSKVL